MKEARKARDDKSSSLESCKRSRSFGCELDTEVCKKDQQSLTSCLASYSAKNSSYRTLKEECDELTEDWENATASHATVSLKVTQGSHVLPNLSQDNSEQLKKWSEGMPNLS